MLIVTAGYVYADIDAYGGCIAYAELKRLQGVEAQAVIVAPLNKSVTPTVRAWNSEVRASYTPNPDDQFVIIDVSDPDYFEKFVDRQRVIEVIDHHVTFERYWQARIGDAAKIEFIGAACTLVYEAWAASGKLDEMSQTSARVLATGILDNTLDFRATITTDRDRRAYEALVRSANLPDDWPTRYFHDCQTLIEADLSSAIHNDLKALDLLATGTPQTVGQLVVWDGKELVDTQLPVITTVLSTLSEQWVMNIVSISENKSYFLVQGQQLSRLMADICNLQFSDGLAVANRLWLRKEIVKAATTHKK
jgi:inorganic pyrophosphatase/exopolyphosphatase